MWTSFYKERVNSTYQQYFEGRYVAFLGKILSLKPHSVLEEGCGIGSVSKFLLKHNVSSRGFDIDFDMVDMAKCNTGYDNFYQDDILNPANSSAINHELIVTHGVLEHFSDRQIESILNRYRSLSCASIHYVPLDKYSCPSFGDERLLPLDHWLKLTKCDEHGLFNEGYDLWFIVNPNSN